MRPAALEENAAVDLDDDALFGESEVEAPAALRGPRARGHRELELWDRLELVGPALEVEGPLGLRVWSPFRRESHHSP